MAYRGERLNRVLGYRPIRISDGVRRAIWSSLLAIPLAVTATGISDSATVSDAVRYVVAPGTMLAVRVVRVAPSHRGLTSCRNIRRRQCGGDLRNVLDDVCGDT